MPKIGPYSTSEALAKIDGRTREARLMRRVRAELTAHVGGQPSATQRALIERAVQLQLRLAMMDAEDVAGSGLTERNSRQYLAYANSLARLMRQIGLRGAPTRVPSLAEYLAARPAEAASSAKPAAAPIARPALPKPARTQEIAHRGEAAD